LVKLHHGVGLLELLLQERERRFHFTDQRVLLAYFFSQRCQEAWVWIAVIFVFI
jgi:hypothetical protein